MVTRKKVAGIEVPPFVRLFCVFACHVLAVPALSREWRLYGFSLCVD